MKYAGDHWVPALPTALGMQCMCRYHHSIFIGIQPVPGADFHSSDVYNNIRQPFAALFRRHRHQSKRSNAYISRAQFRCITHTTKNQHPCPTIASGCSSQIPAHQCFAQRSSTVNHQNAAFS